MNNTAYWVLNNIYMHSLQGFEIMPRRCIMIDIHKAAI